MTGSLPTDPAARKAAPMAEGLLWYFPAALAEVARVSKCGNDQHNPGEPMHHARGKSTDHADCILRHLVDAGLRDSDGQRHTAKVAWRALALLQEELERDAGAPMPRNARLAEFHAAALGIKLPTMTGAPHVAARERSKAMWAGALPELTSAKEQSAPVPCPQTADAFAIRESRIPNPGTIVPNPGTTTAAMPTAAEVERG